jgi:dTMP kinase
VVVKFLPDDWRPWKTKFELPVSCGPVEPEKSLNKKNKKGKRKTVNDAGYGGGNHWLVQAPRVMKTFAESQFPGRLIAVEGLDGSGKSTQIYLLKRWLEAQGTKVYFSEWNSSKLVKSATRKGKNHQLLTPTTFSLIHATDFADRYERHLVPLLRAGYIVLCDRYIFTAFARDVTRGCPPDWVRGNYSFACVPDLTMFFKADLEVSLNRILEGRPKLKFFEAGMDLRLANDPHESFKIFQGRILDQYLAMSTEFRFKVIDANQPAEKQQVIVRKLVSDRIDLKKFKRRSPLPLPPALHRERAEVETQMEIETEEDKIA